RVAHELRGRHAVDDVRHRAAGAQVRAADARRARPLPLRGHRLFKPVQVHLEAPLGGDLLGELLGNAEGVVQAKDVLAFDDFFAPGLPVVHELVEQVDALVQRLPEAPLLQIDHVINEVPPGRQIRVADGHLPDDHVADVGQHRFLDAQLASVAGGPAQQPPQNVAPAFVAGHDAGESEERDGPHMVRDHPQRHVGVGVFAVLHAGPLGHRVHDGPHQIDVEVAGNALQHRCHALKAHARVDARPLQLRVRAVFVLMKLDKDQIPNLQITLAVVAARLALFVRAAELGAAVDVNLRARAARADADLPEVVLFAQAHDALLGDADLLMPDAGRLVVLPVDADPKPVLGHLHALGDELPRP